MDILYCAATQVIFKGGGQMNANNKSQIAL